MDLTVKRTKDGYAIYCGEFKLTNNWKDKVVAEERLKENKVTYKHLASFYVMKGDK